MKKHLLLVYADQIKQVEILRETDKSVFISVPTSPNHSFRKRQREKKEAKETSYHIYCDSWQEAHDRLVQIRTAEVEEARQTLQRRICNLEKVLAMKKPE